MNLVLDVDIVKNLEKNDILVFDGNKWVNMSKEEYLTRVKEDIKDLQKSDEETTHDLMEHLKQIELLRQRDLFVAKSIYDNYIERGLIDENDEFDQKFYDFVFNNYELKPEDLDNDFVKILNKLKEHDHE